MDPFDLNIELKDLSLTDSASKASQEVTTGKTKFAQSQSAVDDRSSEPRIAI